MSRQSTKAKTPPPVVACARVLEYVVLDSAGEYSGRTLLFVDGKELGRVPCLAICQDRQDILLFHCASDWTVLGCSAHNSVADAKGRAASIYAGVGSRWVQTNGRSKRRKRT